MLSYNSWKSLASNKNIRYAEFTNHGIIIAGFGQSGKTFLTRISDSGDKTDFNTVFKSTAIAVNTEADVLELSESDATIGKIDGRHKRAFDFSSSVIYIGYTQIGVPETSAGWTIRKMILDTSGNPTSETWTAVGLAIWNNRTSEIYN